MSSQPTVQGHPGAIANYIRHGWKLVPIPAGTKGPQLKGWNLQQNTITDTDALPPHHGIGLAHAYSGTMALDIDEWNRAKEELIKFGIDLDSLYAAPDAVVIDSGRQGHGKLLYAMPFGMAMNSKKLVDTDANGDKYNYLDFRCATASGLTMQDVLPPSIHPDTLQPYRWAGKGHWEELPQIPTALFDYWSGLIDADKQMVIPTEGAVDASWDEIQQALEHISPDLSRDEWVQVGMSLHWAGCQTDSVDQAMLIWDEWSSQSSKYRGMRDVVTQWRSFKDTDAGVKLGTFFHIAKQHGWTRPRPDVSALFNSVSNQKIESTKQMLDPVALVNGLRPPAPEIDMSIFPSVLADRAMELSNRVGCDPLVPLFAGLAAVCGAADSRTRLELQYDWEVPPVLWLMTIGDPGDKKTPGSSPMFRILSELENEAMPDFKRKHMEWEGREAAYIASKKAFLDSVSDPDNLLDNDVGTTLPKELDAEPVPMRLMISDVTSQKMVRLAAERPYGMLCYLDEMNSWIGKLTDKHGGEDRSTWTVSYEAKRYMMDRVGAGSIPCENLAICMYGNVQPRVYRENMSALSSDGTLQRFLPAVLRHHLSRKPQKAHGISDTEERWNNTIRMIHAMPTMKYKLSTGAEKVFDDYLDWYDDSKQRERLLSASDDYMTAFGKMEGTSGRIMLVFHLMTEPFSPEISAENASRAINFIRTYLIPSFRYTLGELSGGVDESMDAWVTAHVVQLSGEKETITLRELKRAAKTKIAKMRDVERMSRFDSDLAIREAMALMEKWNYVALISENGVRNHYEWAINPHLSSLFSEYRDKIIMAKQKQLDDAYTKVTMKDNKGHPIVHHKALGWREDMIKQEKS